MHKRILYSGIALLALVLGACKDPAATSRIGTHPQQAQPLQLNGVENLHRVSAELYRSGSRIRKRFTALEQMGIRSVLNLREYHKDTRKARHTGLHLMAYR